MDQGEQVNSLKVSVIIPVYNTGAYVEEAVRSIMNQTLRDIEIIIINDGSTDNSLSVIKKLAREDSRIRFYSQENRGLSNTRNVGIEVTSGQFIYFMDSDDLLAPRAFEICYPLCIEKKLDFVFFNAESFSEDMNIPVGIDYQRGSLFDEQKVYSGKEMLSIMLNKNKYRASACLNFIRRSVIVRYNLNFYPNIIHEDELFTALLFMQSNRVGYVNRTFFKRRFREDSIMTRKYSMWNVSCYFVVAEQLILFSRGRDGDNELEQLVDRLLTYILDPNIYKANSLALKNRLSIFKHCLKKRYLKYLSVKTVVVLLFPITIKIKKLFKKTMPLLRKNRLSFRII